MIGLSCQNLYLFDLKRFGRFLRRAHPSHASRSVLSPNFRVFRMTIFIIYHLALRLSFSEAPPFLTSYLLFLFVGLKFFVTLQAIWAYTPILFYSLAVICNSQWRAVITQYTQEPDCHIQQRPDSLRLPWERRTAKASKQVHLLLKRQFLHCRWGLFCGRDVFAKPFSKLGILGFQFLNAPK